MSSAFREEHYETIDEAVETWGIDAQIDMAIEECGELIVALQHLKREREWARAEVFEELADVTVMREQLARYFDDFEEDVEIARAMGQLEARLEGSDDG